MDEIQNKTALILDTNIVLAIGIKKFEEVYNILSKNYDVYIPEITILERISQKKIETRKAFDEVDVFKTKYSRYVNVSKKKHINYYYTIDKETTEKGYKDLLKDKVIPYNPDNECFKKVIDRVMMRIPPFHIDPNSSDKGFKDTLMWLSILDYIPVLSKYENVKFITNDGGFTKHKLALQTEYKLLCDNDLEVLKSSFIDNILNSDGQATKEPDIQKLHIKDISELRDKIDWMTNNIICFEEHDYNYGEYYEKYFELNTRLNGYDVSNMLENLRVNLQAYYLNKEIYPHLIFPEIDIQSKYKIPINDMEAFLNLYETILENNPDILPQFIAAVCEKFNENYVEEKSPSSVDEELPF